MVRNAHMYVGMCVIPGYNMERMNPPAMSIGLVICEEDEECVPFHPTRRPFPWPRENIMMTSVEIGYCFRLECI